MTLLQLTLSEARATVRRAGWIVPTPTAREPLLEAELRHSGSLRSIQALGRQFALPLALVYVALIGLLAFGHRCPSGSGTSGFPWGAVAAGASACQERGTSPGLLAHLDAGHTDSSGDHRCALCALHHQEPAPLARAPLVRLTASPALPFSVIAPSPLTGAPLTATSRGPPRI